MTILIALLAFVLQSRGENVTFYNTFVLTDDQESELYKTCHSASSANFGGWSPASSAPRDGTTVEMLETYGLAPTYGLFKWTTDQVSATMVNGKHLHFKSNKPSWVSVDEPGTGVVDDNCLFWHPYKKTGKYVDPTGGQQKSVAYWCRASHLTYDKKTDSCKSR